MSVANTNGRETAGLPVVAGLASFFLAAPAAAFPLLPENIWNNGVVPPGVLSALTQMTVFAVLTLALARRNDTDFRWGVIAVSLIAFGCGLEAAQYYLGQGTFEAKDIIARICGIALTMVGLALHREVRNILSAQRRINRYG